ncbi:MAG: RNA polymerase sigma factor [Polaribacter sp.]
MIDEIALVKDLQNNSSKEVAFRTLITNYKERLYWHIRKIVINHADTDDVLQNTFIKIYYNIESFNKQSKLYSWMYRIATNEAITFINKRAKEQHTDITTYYKKVANSLQSDVYFNGDEIQIILQKAIALLPEKQRLVFNMKYFDGMKYDEISEILETTVGSLKASYHHAVKKIEHFIKNNTD